jgi:Flp pilus assembly pilin Flp
VFVRMFKRLWRDQGGVSLIDYSILVALITVLVVVGISVAGSWIQRMWAHLLPLLGNSRNVAMGIPHVDSQRPSRKVRELALLNAVGEVEWKLAPSPTTESLRLSVGSMMQGYRPPSRRRR